MVRCLDRDDKEMALCYFRHNVPSVRPRGLLAVCGVGFGFCVVSLPALATIRPLWRRSQVRGADECGGQPLAERLRSRDAQFRLTG